MRQFENSFYRCQCECSEHQLILTLDPEDEYQECWIEFHLSSYHRFWKRCWIAIKYVFGHKSRFGAFDTMIIKKHDAEKIIGLLQDFVKIRKDHEERTGITVNNGSVFK